MTYNEKGTGGFGPAGPHNVITPLIWQVAPKLPTNAHHATCPQALAITNPHEVAR